MVSRGGVGNRRTGGLYRLSSKPGGRTRLSAELKFKDKAIIASGIPAAADTSGVSYVRYNNLVSANFLECGYLYSLGSIFTGLETGAGANQRIGRKITVKSILFDLNFWGNADAANYDKDPIIFKLWFVMDKQANGTTLDASDIMTYVPGLIGTDVGVQAPEMVTSFQPYIANRQRFSILKEYRGVFKPTVVSQRTSGAGGGSVADQKTYKNIQFYKRCNIPIEYGGAAGTGDITEIKSNNIGAIFGFSKTNGTNHDAYATMYGYVRIRFQDA